jgi:hypothetical protein
MARANALLGVCGSPTERRNHSLAATTSTTLDSHCTRVREWTVRMHIGSLLKDNPHIGCCTKQGSDENQDIRGKGHDFIGIEVARECRVREGDFSTSHHHCPAFTRPTIDDARPRHGHIRRLDCSGVAPEIQGKRISCHNERKHEQFWAASALDHGSMPGEQKILSAELEYTVV